MFLLGSVAALPAAESSFRFYYAFHICFQREVRKNLRRMIVRLAQGCECGAVTEDEQSIAVEYVGSSWQQVVNCAGVLLQGCFFACSQRSVAWGSRMRPRILWVTVCNPAVTVPHRSSAFLSPRVILAR